MLNHLPVPPDVVFKFGQDGCCETISAHKTILAMGSEYFCGMFFGPAAGEPKTFYTVTDFSKETFQPLLDYVYADKCPESESDENPSQLLNLMEILQCALYHGVVQLATFCRATIVTTFSCLHVSELPAVEVLVKAELLEEDDIIRAALCYFDKFTLSSFRASDLSLIGVEEFSRLIGRSEIQLSAAQEIELYNIAKQYAQAKLSDGTPTLRDALKPLLHQVRFPLMTIEQLQSGPVTDGVLTHEETRQLQVTAFKRGLGKMPRLETVAGFSCAPRMSKSVKPLGRFLFGKITEDIFTTKGSIDIVPDQEACPETSRRFLDLCAVGYPFDIQFEDLEVPQELYGAAEGDIPRQEDFTVMNLPSTESSLMHDAAGTVSIHFVEETSPDGEATQFYALKISTGEDILEDDSGVVFGRLSGWLVGVSDFRELLKEWLVRDFSEMHVRTTLVD